MRHGSASAENDNSMSLLFVILRGGKWRISETVTGQSQKSPVTFCFTAGTAELGSAERWAFHFQETHSYTFSGCSRQRRAQCRGTTRRWRWSALSISAGQQWEKYSIGVRDDFVHVCLSGIHCCHVSYLVY